MAFISFLGRVLFVSAFFRRSFFLLGMSSGETLSVAFAGDTDNALKYVLDGCHNLQKLLEISDSLFGDSTLRAGLHRYYNMRFMWMSSCRVTLQACQEVSKLMLNLAVEVFTSEITCIQDNAEYAGTAYMYLLLEERRNDAPEYVKLL